MERPWSYFLLLIAAWLAGLWGLWLIGEAWVNWPIEGPGALRDAARGRVWTGAGLLGAATALGGLASIVRLLHDGLAALAQRAAAARPDAAATPAVERPPAPPPPASAPVADTPRAFAPANGSQSTTEPPRLVVGGATEPAPAAEAARRGGPRIETPHIETPRSEPARGEGPRLDPSRRDAPRRPADDPPGRREPKLVADP
ncbi:MAG: hypothetical protein JNL66_22135 [Alphaproteobacteria bacterium]|nr:hypothetical protein [Alphaproteobacteria bacterium]